MKETFIDLNKLMLKMGFKRMNKNNFFVTGKSPKTRLYDRGIEWEEEGFIMYSDGDCVLGWL